METDSTEMDEKETVAVAEPPLEWYLGVSEDLKVSQRRWGQLYLFDFVGRSLSNHFRPRRKVRQRQQTSGRFGN